MERTMNKLVLSTLAVMTAVSICGVQPVDAKSVKPDPTMTMLQMPKNDEISVGNGTTKEINKQTQSLVNNVAVSTRSMIKKNWKTIYIKAVPSGLVNIPCVLSLLSWLVLQKRANLPLLHMDYTCKVHELIRCQSYVLSYTH